MDSHDSSGDSVARKLAAKRWPGRALRPIYEVSSTKSSVMRYALVPPLAETTTFILKQFPPDRSAAFAREVYFLGRLSGLDVAPRLFEESTDDLALAMEDLGDSGDSGCLGAALARFHSRTRGGDWGASRLPSRASLAIRIEANCASLGLSMAGVSENLDAVDRTLAESPQCLLHADLMPGNSGRGLGDCRLLDFDEATPGPAVVDLATAVAAFPNAPQAVEWTPTDIETFERSYRDAIEEAQFGWNKESTYKHQRSAGVAFWIASALGAAIAEHLSQGARPADIRKRLRALGAHSELVDSFPALGELARQMSTRLAGA